MPASESKGCRGHLMIVDDDDLFRESVMRNLEDAGFSVDGISDGTQALDHLTRGAHADAVLLDWKMPNLTGIEVLRLMRDARIDVPVIFLTVLGDQIYEEAALVGGAIDFVEKSRSFAILLRRIELTLAGLRASVRRTNEDAQSALIERGDLTLQLDSSRALWQGRKVELSLMEFRVVKLLVDQIGRNATYRELYDTMRGEGFIAGTGEVGYRANVRACIKRIRKKFQRVDVGFGAIENFPSLGYRWRSEEAP